MRRLVLVVVLVVAVAVAGSVMAVPAGKTIEYEGGAMGKVLFDGKTHADAGMKCPDCHSGLFKMKKGDVKITAPHKPGEFCGACHNGDKAFDQQGNCTKCHKK